jgi:HSP20 family protein
MNLIQMPKPFHENPWRPAADVYHCPEGWLVKFDLAGVRPEEVEVSVRGRHLLVSGIRRDWITQADHRFYSMEICYNRFERAVELPCELDTAELTLDYRYGMLLVRLLVGKPPA